MSASMSIPRPGWGGAAGSALASATQGDELPGGSARLKAQATVLTSAVGVALGYAAISSGATAVVVMSGALAIAAAPVAATLSVVYLLQAGTPEQAQAYQSAMDIVEAGSSIGGLVGLTASVVAGRSYKQALEVSKGAGLAERFLSIEKIAGLASGYEAGSFVVDGGSYVAKHMDEVIPLELPKPKEPSALSPQTTARPKPPKEPGPDVDRDTSGQRRAEQARENRERQREMKSSRNAAEPAQKPGRGESQQGSKGTKGGEAPAGKKPGGREPSIKFGPLG